MRPPRRRWIAAASTLGAGLALLLLAGCSGQGHVEARLTYPPPTQPETVPLPQPRAPGGPGAPGGPELPAPLGTYFLHNGEFALEGCTYLGERTTGDTAPAGRSEAEQARSRAVLDMAEQAKLLGGNVVLLPSFREDYRAGRLVGRVYRCGDVQRRRLYEQAAATQQLTIVPP